jgi:hypothetical protein
MLIPVIAVHLNKNDTVPNNVLSANDRYPSHHLRYYKHSCHLLPLLRNQEIKILYSQQNRPKNMNKIYVIKR